MVRLFFLCGLLALIGADTPIIQPAQWPPATHGDAGDLLHIIDDIRQEAALKLDQAKRGEQGQYMTPAATAELLASMFDDLSGDISLLDAGAGVGSLTAAFLQRVIREGHVKKIIATTYETDQVLLNDLHDSVTLFARMAAEQHIQWHSNVVPSDFIASAVNQLLARSVDATPITRYNKAILNPPYFKIGSQSRQRKLLQQVGIETGNLYSAFVALAIKLLEPGGELVAITPRSFCNGPYFKGFRDVLLDETALRKIRIFDSRTKAFKSDKVLQENVIFHLVKGAPQGDVEISSSSCAEEPNPIIRIAPFHEVVNPANPERFIHIVTSEQEADIAVKISGLPCSLSDLSLEVSTGKVVDFRTRDNLRMAPEADTVPLIYPTHLKNGSVLWPISGGKKPNALVNNSETRKLMVPNGTYILTKRLTAKEEKRRIVAALYEPSVADVDVVGFDNKTNYFHAQGKPLQNDIARGLWLFLNSTIVDQYFRQFNGHTQVNATDLRSLRYPTVEQLQALGLKAKGSALPVQEDIDALVSAVFSDVDKRAPRLVICTQSQRAGFLQPVS